MYESRRDFLKTSALTGLAGTAISPGLLSAAAGETSFPVGKAEHCIMIWLGGGSCHIDTWDPKIKGDAKERTPGSYYDSIPTAISGVEVCEHLPKCADILDRFIPVRSVHHEVIDEHAIAANRMHTGRPTSGTVVYPSIGSIVAHQRGAAGEGVPAYVLIGYPNITRGPGFLGTKAGYVYLLDTNSGPNGLSKPADLSQARRERREKLLAKMRAGYLRQLPHDQFVKNYDDTLAQALDLSGPNFMKVFNLAGETTDLRNSYGGEFGQRCLLARRLIESGVRFIEVSHNLNFVNGTGWDTHNEGQLNQHLLIKELDSALSTLVTDLERKKLLDKTMIVVASEFGRPPQFDAGGGRGHHSKAFTVILAGGGLNTGQVIGETDELGAEIISRPVSVPDLHASIHCALGVNPSLELTADGDRPVPITDQGEPVRELFS